MRRSGVVALLTVVALTLVPSAAVGKSTGALRMLVVRGTWGPEPFSEAQVRAVAGESASWLQTSSFGKLSLSADITPWLSSFPAPKPCGANPFTDLADIASALTPGARAAGFDPTAYDKVVYLMPTRPACGSAGIAANDREIGLWGRFHRRLLVHELGHTFGIDGHADLWRCQPRPCNRVIAGNPYDVMGVVPLLAGEAGIGDFNASEKFAIGWLSTVVHAERDGEHVIALLERPSALPQALVVTTARNEYWFEHRQPVDADAPLTGSSAVGGLLVYAGPTADPRVPTDFPLASTAPATPRVNGLIADPAGTGRDAVLPTESFQEPGSFRVTVLGQTGDAVEARFAWTDRTPPTKPRVRVVRREGRTVLTWTASVERGSGLSRYDVLLNGRVVATRRPGWTSYRVVLKVSRGRVAVVAVDRAGNRSR